MKDFRLKGGYLTYIVKNSEKIMIYIVPFIIQMLVLYFHVHILELLAIDIGDSYDYMDSYLLITNIFFAIIVFISTEILEKIRQKRILALDLPILYQKKNYVVYGDKNVILIGDILFTFDEVEKWRDASHYTVEVTINNKEYDWKSNYEVYQFIMKNLKDKGIYQHELRYIKASNNV